MVYFHITPKRNLKKILELGLIAKVGPRSKKLKEDLGIYLFTSLSAAEEAVMNWLGAEFSENTDLVCLKIQTPGQISFPLDLSTTGIEMTYCAVSKENIPSEWISVERLSF